MGQRAPYAVLGLALTASVGCNRSRAMDYENGKWRPSQPDKSSEDGTTVGDQENDLDFVAGSPRARPRRAAAPAPSPPESDEGSDDRQRVRGVADESEAHEREDLRGERGTTGEFGGPSRGAGL